MTSSFLEILKGDGLWPQGREQQVLGEEVERGAADVLHGRLEQGRGGASEARGPHSSRAHHDEEEHSLAPGARAHLQEAAASYWLWRGLCHLTNFL